MYAQIFPNDFTMKTFLLYLATLVITVVKTQSQDYDVVIYGGSSAGIMAAVQAARMGKSVVLINPTVHIGGLTSSGLGWTDLGDASTIGGLSFEFYQALYKYYNNDDAWRQETRDAFIKKVKKGTQWDREMRPRKGIMPVFEPHVAERVFEAFIRQHSIKIVRDQWLNRESGVRKSGGKIETIKMLSGETYSGKMFIDATYEGDLMAASGVSFVVGREANSQYQELLNGIRTANAVSNQLPAGIDPFVVRGNPGSGLLPGVNESAGGADGTADKKIQAYCYRLCLTNDSSNRVVVQKPAEYKEQDFELLLRVAESGWTKFFKLDKMPNKKTDSNNSGGISTDYIGMNYEYPEASYTRRKEIEAAHLYWHKGLLWTLQHHPRVPEATRKQYLEWGLAKDEFADNNHFPYQLYVREARRMVSDLVITEHYCLNKKSSDRPIAIGSYTMDSHNTQRHVAGDKHTGYTVKNEGDVQYPVTVPYGIDYGSIIPKASEATNLLVPVCISASHIAYGSVRMEPVFMMLGQAAATAAALAIDAGITIQDINYNILKSQLLQDKMMLLK